MEEILQRAMQALQGGVREADVDAWIARETNGQFTSLQQLQQQAQTPGMMQGIAQHLGEGAAMGWSGELAGKKWQQQLDAFREQHPFAAGAANFVGSLLPSLTGAGLVARGAGTAARVVPRVLQGLGIGAAEGAISGAGYAGEGEKGPAALISGAIGGAAGGSLPIFGAVGGAVARRGQMLLSPEAAAAKEALRKIDRAVTSGTMTTDDFITRFRELDAIAPGQVTLADLSPQLRRLLDASATQSPVVAEMVEKMVAPRNINQAGRMASSIEDILGAAPDVPAALAIQEANKAALGAQLFEGMELPASTMQKLVDFFKRPILKDAAEAANAKARMAGITDVGPTMKNAQQVRDYLGSAARRTPGGSGHDFKVAAEELRRILEEVPGYDAAAKTYRAQVVLLEALEDGQAVMAQVQRPAVVKRMLAEIEREGGAPAVEAFRYGMVDELYNGLKRIGTNRDAAARLMNRSADYDELLRVAIPDPDELNRLLSMAAGETDLRKLSRTIGGSQTGYRTADAAGMAADELGATAGAGTIMGGPKAGALAAGAQAFRDIPNRMQEQVAEQMGPQLLQTGPKVEEVLNLIASRNEGLQRSLRLMGLLRNTTAGAAGAAAGGLLAPR